MTDITSAINQIKAAATLDLNAGLAQIKQVGAADVLDNTQHRLARQGDGIEEADPGDALVDGRNRQAAPGQFEAIETKVFRRRLVGRTVDELGKALDAVDIGDLSFGREAADGHVVDQALPQRADGRIGHWGLLSWLRSWNISISRQEVSECHRPLVLVGGVVQPGWADSELKRAPVCRPQRKRSSEGFVVRTNRLFRNLTTVFMPSMRSWNASFSRQESFPNKTGVASRKGRSRAGAMFVGWMGVATMCAACTDQPTPSPAQPSNDAAKAILLQIAELQGLPDVTNVGDLERVLGLHIEPIPYVAGWHYYPPKDGGNRFLSVTRAAAARKDLGLSDFVAVKINQEIACVTIDDVKSVFGENFSVVYAQLSMSFIDEESRKDFIARATYPYDTMVYHDARGEVRFGFMYMRCAESASVGRKRQE